MQDHRVHLVAFSLTRPAYVARQRGVCPAWCANGVAPLLVHVRSPVGVVLALAAATHRRPVVRLVPSKAWSVDAAAGARLTQVLLATRRRRAVARRASAFCPAGILAPTSATQDRAGLVASPFQMRPVAVASSGANDSVETAWKHAPCAARFREHAAATSAVAAAVASPPTLRYMQLAQRSARVRSAVASASAALCAMPVTVSLALGLSRLFALAEAPAAHFLVAAPQPQLSAAGTARGNQLVATRCAHAMGATLDHALPAHCPAASSGGAAMLAICHAIRTQCQRWRVKRSSCCPCWWLRRRPVQRRRLFQSSRHRPQRFCRLQSRVRAALRPCDGCAWAGTRRARLLAQLLHSGAVARVAMRSCRADGMPACGLATRAR